MKSVWLMAVFVLVLPCTGRQTRFHTGNNTDENEALQFLKWANKEIPDRRRESVNAEWDFATNITDENHKNVVESDVAYEKFTKDVIWKKATEFAWTNFSDEVQRQFKVLTRLGAASLSDEELKEFSNLGATMSGIYSTALVCPYKAENGTNCTVALEPDLSRIMASSTDYDELLHAWVSWRDAAGKPNRANFEKYSQISNQVSKFDGFSDRSDAWLSRYENDTIEEEFERLWDQLRPFYLQLHAYVRRKLINVYGSDKIKADGPIPAHILGNMWAQTWENIYKLTVPFPNKTSIDVTQTMVKQEYTPLKMFKLAEEFFESLGFGPMTETFWNKSIIEKPKDRKFVCHASAWDFSDGEDFRIKQCTDITMEYLETTHHEMGHIQYYMEYKDQPVVFQEGANPGFHEAIGDLIAVSVMSPSHLKKIGLLDEISADNETEINYLFHRALKKVAFLPFGYLMDKWRWGVFRGEIKPDEYNKKWWELRLKYQGLIPPVTRSEEDFDPAAKYHVASFVEYGRYYVAAILQMQFHKILCEIAAHNGSLHLCDLYESKEAGKKLREMLQLGSSVPWDQALGILSSNKINHMDAAPLLEFYRPLIEWLQEENKNEYIGWKE